jgi:hypothetical protein
MIDDLKTIARAAVPFLIVWRHRLRCDFRDHRTASGVAKQ